VHGWAAQFLGGRKDAPLPHGAAKTTVTRLERIGNMGARIRSQRLRNDLTRSHGSCRIRFASCVRAPIGSCRSRLSWPGAYSALGMQPSQSRAARTPIASNNQGPLQT
jgi:hypothetical protein